MVDLGIDFLGLHLENPLVLASGILGTSPEVMERCAKNGAGAITSKSCGLTERIGHPNPVCIDWGHGVINAIGLTNPGVKEEVLLLQKTRTLLRELKVPLFASIFAPTVADFYKVAALITEAEPDLIEVNISCPNVADEFGTPFAASQKSASEVTTAVKKATSIPISVKLAPNVPDIARIALATQEAGADAITAVNTVPGMLIDARAAKPILANRSGGISGAAIKPVALRCVAEIAARVQIPIIGTGGVSCGEDAVEMIMAGATLVGIGTAIWQRGPDVFSEVNREIQSFMDEEGYLTLGDMRGAALR